ncbi:methyltransferase domain-containing protein [Hoeflea prorocentri]|uniref:Methyltransferase domain-containing protein n=1 Tax=Hoeflea prorocentri TaxID=1922333 RepID=A0A9X3UNJ9_9HYPH|nr:methyltransferase domain-containing protein [Hoeflea prorocentri]MCY6383675.1 methyltransferase domain-containing protein [Hoeflea prorocentri]MDA5401475.1 methyltransferase domain-containing protein [Hoeflea prorocentri]
MEADRLFDTELVRRNRLRALRAATEGADFLLDIVSSELGERLNVVERTFQNAIALHAHTGSMADLMTGSGKVSSVVRVEQDQQLLNEGHTGIVSDLERLPVADEAVGLIISPLSLHLVDDLPGLLLQINRALSPDGLLLAALPGGGTLAELREALIAAESEQTGGVSARVMPFADVRDCGMLLQRAGFALPVVDAETYTVRYDHMFALMRDLRNMGMSNPLAARSRKPAARSLFLRAAEIYAERFSDPDGRIRATFNILYVSGWKPHASQQKPLAPGSAKASLAAALGSREHKL